MADDEVEVVACTSLISASPGAAVVISDGRRESENIKHRLTRTFATEISLVHLTRFCRSCVLVGSSGVATGGEKGDTPPTPTMAGYVIHVKTKEFILWGLYRWTE